MKQNGLSERLKTASIIITLFLTLTGVGVNLVNYLFANNQQPFSFRIQAVEKKTETLQDSIKDLATKEQMTRLQQDFERIEGKLDQFILKENK